MFLQKWLFLLLGSFLWVGCVENASPPKLPQYESLVVGTALTAPFEYRDAETNELIGFDVDLMTAIAQSLGVKLEWREFAFADLLTTLEAGTVDVVIAGMYITPAREEVVDMSQAYLETGLVMVVQAQNTTIQALPDLAGKTVGVKEGATGERWANDLRETQHIDLEIRRYTDTLDSLDDLNAGLLDAVFNDYLNSLQYIKTHPNVAVRGEIFDPAGLGIAVKSGNTELLALINTSLAELKSKGEIDRLYDKWLNPNNAQ